MASSAHEAASLVGAHAGEKNAKVLVVTGGTVSGLGKGTAISSIGVVLKSHGIRVTAMKIDPYLNVDAGTMSPFEHGEVFVLDDGAEADLDLGNYERFLDLNLTASHSLTTGKIYDQVIKRERAGEYLGKTVQMVPHVTDAIQNWILNVARQSTSKSEQAPEVCLVELGGTVGDIESAVYLEALQQLSFKLGPDNFMMIHLGFIPLQTATGEQKTKPAQNSVRQLREAGLKPDLLLCRSDKPLSDETRHKLSLFCQVTPQDVISLHDVNNIYHVPMLLAAQNVGERISQKFGLGKEDVITPVFKSIFGAQENQDAEEETEVQSEVDSSRKKSQLENAARDKNGDRLKDWGKMAERFDSLKVEVKIALVGKYTGMPDSYTSVVKSLRHACIEAGLKLHIDWVESTDLEDNARDTEPTKYEEAWRKIRGANGVILPGGFGSRGVEGMILAANYCRVNNTPFFGICIGLQIAVIEASRNLLHKENANSSEFDSESNFPCIIFMPEGSTTIMGGTMRLGSRVTIIRDKSSLAYKLYDSEPVIFERHRHRYEVNPDYVGQLEQVGLNFSGQDELGQRMEIMEYSGPEDNPHPFYLGVQFHPEFKSRPNRPSPPFLGFILAAGKMLTQRLDDNGGSLKLASGFSRKLMVSSAFGA